MSSLRGHLLRFGLFAVAYYLPLILEPSRLGTENPEVRRILHEALASPAVQWELARNLLTHFGLLLVCYGLISVVATGVAPLMRIRPAIAWAFVLVLSWLLLIAGNGVLFPLSDYSSPLSFLVQPELAVSLALSLGVAAALAFFHGWTRPARLTVWAGWIGAFGVAAGVAAPWQAHSRSEHAERNVIIVGVDSLSATMFEALRPELPHLSDLVDSATDFRRAYTPIGRTFPAWVSILSGQPPAEHGAVFNLRSVDRVARDSLVTHALHRNGYQTVFAMDERRFANIDESFGFDRIIGPKAGALDFMLQGVNDTPLTNLLLQSGLSTYLLPFSRLNVASHANYDADGFVDEIVASVSGTKRMFLAVHFESAHFPFKSRHAVRAVSDADWMTARYATALTAVDAQVGRLIERLRQAGALDDALVILLSDHGESLGDRETLISRTGEAIRISGNGHGVNLASDYQNRVLLAAMRFQGGAPTDQGTVRDDQISLTDVRAIIERYVATGDVRVEQKNLCMPVETGLRLAAASEYKAIDHGKLAAEAAGYYEIDSVGRMHLHESGLLALVRAKDVGWRCPDRLTYYSYPGDRYFAYRIDAGGRRLTEIDPPPGDVAQIAAYRAKLRQIAGG